jgi:hypothetical protein
MDESMGEVFATEQAHVCSVHPERETELQCNRCERYMCVQCAVRTPVGYRCRECVRGIQDTYFTATQTDYMIIGAVCGLLNLIGGSLVVFTGAWLLIVIIVAAPAGGAIAEAALRLTKRRRGRHSAQIGAAAAAVGALLPLVVLSLMLGALIPDFGALLYAGLSAAAVFGRFQMRI